MRVGHHVIAENATSKEKDQLRVISDVLIEIASGEEMQILTDL